MTDQPGEHSLWTLGSRGGTTILLKLGSLGLQAAQFAIVARVLSVSDFGSFAAAMALVLIVGTVAEFGLVNTGVLSLAEGRPELDVVRDSIRATGVMLVVALTTLLVLVGILLRGDAQVAALMLLPGFVASKIDIPFLAAHIYRVRTTQIAVADFLSRVVLVLAVVPLMIIGSSVESIVAFALLGLGLFLAEMTSFLLVLPGVPVRGKRATEPSLHQLKDAIPIGLTNASSVVHSRSDQVILNTMGRSSALAGYAVAARVNEAVLALVNAAGAVTFGAMAQSSTENRAHLVRRIVSLACLGGAVCAFASFVLAPYMMEILGGAQYRDSSDLARILAVALAASVVNLPLAQSVMIAGAASRLLRVSLIGVGLNISMTIGLILVSGAAGAALATAVSEFLGMLLVATLAARHLPGCVPWRSILITFPLIAAGLWGSLTLWRSHMEPAGALVAIAAIAVIALEALRGTFSGATIEADGDLSGLGNLSGPAGTGRGAELDRPRGGVSRDT